MPFAPRLLRSSSSAPLLEQLVGILGKVLPPITCMGRLLSCCPAIVRSAVGTGPQVKPSTKGRHSTTALPPAPVCWGSEMVRAEERVRRPGEPVSTRMPLTVWQFEVLPGAQTMTLVNASLMERRFVPAVGPVLTVMLCTLSAAFEPPPLLLLELLLLEPPQPTVAAKIPARSNEKNACSRAGFIECPRRACLPAT